MNTNMQHPLSALIIGISILLASCVGAYAFYSVHALDNTLSVTGSTKERVMSDSAKWSIDVERIIDEGAIVKGYEGVADDTVKVKKYLGLNGFKPEEITTSPISTSDYYTGSGENQIRKTSVRQTVTVETKDVARVETVSVNTLVLAQEGIRFTARTPEYLISTLPELRIRLIGEAVKDAQKRAQELAGSMEQKVGKMKSASSGVVQVLAPNATAISDYGEYDTSTRDKDVMLTVRAVYLLE